MMWAAIINPLGVLLVVLGFACLAAGPSVRKAASLVSLNPAQTEWKMRSLPETKIVFYPQDKTLQGYTIEYRSDATGSKWMAFYHGREWRYIGSGMTTDDAIALVMDDAGKP